MYDIQCEHLGGVNLNTVSPSNMKHFNYSEADKSYSVALSADNGNLLEVRGGKLYYGIQAPPDTYNLYVSSVSGDDNNPGTINSPLKTIEAAWYKNRQDQSAVIWLKAGETFEIGRDLDAVGGCVKTIRVYGTDLLNPPAPLDSVRSIYRPEMLTNFPRPTIRMKELYIRKNVRRGTTPAFKIDSGATLNIIGANLYLGRKYHYNELHEVYGGEPAVGYWSISMFYGEQGNVKLHGCTITIPETDKGLIQLSAVGSGNVTSCHHSWFGVRVIDERVDKTRFNLISFGFNQSVVAGKTTSGYTLDIHKAFGLSEDTYLQANIDEFLKAGNYTGLRMTDPNKSYPINISTNIDF